VEEEGCLVRTFKLLRLQDETGVSGTGHVAEGIRWSDGSVSLRWLGATPSFVNYEGVPSDIEIQRIGDAHVQVVHGHHGATLVRYDDNR
jgi:hypothetical protein